MYRFAALRIAGVVRWPVQALAGVQRHRVVVKATVILRQAGAPGGIDADLGQDQSHSLVGFVQVGIVLRLGRLVAGIKVARGGIQVHQALGLRGRCHADRHQQNYTA